MPTSVLNFILGLLGDASPRAAEAVEAASDIVPPEAPSNEQSSVQVAEAVPETMPAQAQVPDPLPSDDAGKPEPLPSESAGKPEPLPSESAGKPEPLPSDEAGKPISPPVLPDEAEADLASIWDMVAPDGFPPAFAGRPDDINEPEVPVLPEDSKPSFVGEFDETTGLPLIAMEMRACSGVIEDDEIEDDDLVV